MAKFEMMYNHNRPGLDRIIEADVFRVSGKFFEFLVNKEIVRTLKVDIVTQIRRMDEEELAGDDDEEGDPAQSPEAILTDLDQKNAAAMDELMSSLPGTEDLDEILSKLNDDADLNEILNKLNDDTDLNEILRNLDAT